MIDKGVIKIEYNASDNIADVVARQNCCESYVRVLQGHDTKIVNSNFTKAFGTHDLPMFVHCSDIHNDSTRLESAVKYARYIHADGLFLTGDYPQRGVENGISYVKALDDKYNIDSVSSKKNVPFFVGTGNHDVYQLLNNEYLFDSVISPFASKYKYKKDNNNYTDKCYYYTDLEIYDPRSQTTSTKTYKHIRFIMLDLVDGQQGQLTRWGISQDQINWFVSTLGSTPSDYGVLVGLHTLPYNVILPSEKNAELHNSGK